MTGAYVQSTLMPGETVVYEAKVHWAVYLKPALVALVGAMIMYRQPAADGGMLFGTIFLAAAAVLAVQAMIAQATTEMVITNRRVVAKFGFLRRETYEPQLSQLEGAYLDQSVLGRLLDYGDIRVKGTGGGGSPVPFIADPIRFRNTLLG